MEHQNQIKQILDVAWRRRWWCIVPAALGFVVSLYFAMTLPKLYRASTTILVLRQNAGDLVQSTVTMVVEERFKRIRVQLMSQMYLETIVKEFGFAPADANQEVLERACRQLQDSIEVNANQRDFSSFSITVTDRQPDRAAGVANRLAEIFIKQNTQMRAAQAQGALDTIDGWLEKTETELRERDEEIARYKAQHIHELPDQQGATLQLLTAAQARVQQLTRDIQSGTERLAIMRNEERNRQASADALGVAAAGDNPDVRALSQMDRELQELLTSYTEENPLVKRKRTQIAQFKALHPELEATKASGDADDVTSPDIARLEIEVRALESDRSREQRNIDEMQRRLSSMPLRAQDLTTRTRDYDALKARYNATLSQKEQAVRAQDVELARNEQQFQVEDRAWPPVIPFQPNIAELLFMGIFGGLAVGVGIAAGLEFLDQTIRSEEEFAARFPDLTILGSIPGLEEDTPPSRGVLGRRARSGANAGSLLLASILAHVVVAHGGLIA